MDRSIVSFLERQPGKSAELAEIGKALAPYKDADSILCICLALEQLRKANKISCLDKVVKLRAI